MNKSVALTQLDAAILEAERLAKLPSTPPIDPWYEKTKVALRHIFGTESGHETEFANIRFSSPMYTGSETEEDFAFWQHAGLESALTRLRAWKEEVEVYWPISHGRDTVGNAEPVDLQKISLRQLVSGLSRLSVGSAIAVIGLAVGLFTLGTRFSDSRNGARSDKTIDSLTAEIRRLRPKAIVGGIIPPLHVSTTSVAIGESIHVRKDSIPKAR